MVQPLKVLYLAAEATPWIKVGGLADVAGELPPALQAAGLDVRTAIPLYPGVDRGRSRLVGPLEFEVARRPGSAPASVWHAEARGVPTLLVDGAPIRDPAGVYGEAKADAAKFTFFCQAALAASKREGWAPDIVHANDWHAAPAVLSIAQQRNRDAFWQGTASVQTIHNLAYMGAQAEAAFEAYGLDQLSAPGLPDWAARLPLPLGLATADWLTTVSPTYAREIQTAEMGAGLDAFLVGRSDRLTGILNGIDPSVWDPQHDRSLPATFAADDLAPRAVCKQHLQQELELPVESSIPVIAMVTRIDPQKGIDLAIEAMALLEGERWHFVILGSGDATLEGRLAAFADTHSDRARMIQRFDPQLSRRIYAGADMLLVPSRYEPCGLAQMIAQRYGCVPIVRATGGLRDTVADYQPGGRGTGFVFEPATPQALAEAIRRAMRALGDHRRWPGIQRRAMRLDHSWGASAQRYRQVYVQALEARGGDEHA